MLLSMLKGIRFRAYIKDEGMTCHITSILVWTSKHSFDSHTEDDYPHVTINHCRNLFQAAAAVFGLPVCLLKAMACTPVQVIVLCMSATVQPRERSFTGLERPAIMGPRASAPVDCWTACTIIISCNPRLRWQG